MTPIIIKNRHYLWYGSPWRN